jgi:hypothetical protein
VGGRGGNVLGAGGEGQVEERSEIISNRRVVNVRKVKYLKRELRELVDRRKLQVAGAAAAYAVQMRAQLAASDGSSKGRGGVTTS